MHKSARLTHLKGNFMSNTTADVTGIFSLDTNRLVGFAAKGSPDVTYLAGQDTPTSGIPLTATLSDGGVAFDEPTTAAIIAIAGDASSGSAAQIVDGYPVEVTGTTEVLVSAVPCDVVWIAHNGAAGTITVRDAGVTGTGITAVKTIDMATTPTMQPGSLRTQYGVTATLTAGKATFWVRPL